MRAPTIILTDETEVASVSPHGAQIAVAIRRDYVEDRPEERTEYLLRVRISDRRGSDGQLETPDVETFELNADDFDQLSATLEDAIARARSLGILPPRAAP